MANIITHGSNINGSSVQAYAKDGSTIALDMNHLLTEDGAPYYEMSQVEALSIVRILEASIRDSQQGTFITEKQEG